MRAAVVGHNATRETRAALRKRTACLIGSVSYFREKHVEQISPLVLKILEGVAVPPAVYVGHRLITAENVALYDPESAGQEAMPDVEQTQDDHPLQLAAFS